MRVKAVKQALTFPDISISMIIENSQKGDDRMTLMQIFPALRELSFFSMAFRFFIACICGGVIGYARGLHQRPAGFRTHVLVCIGAASTMLMSQFCVEVLHVPGDALRVSAQVVSGIGFLGAGCIIHMGVNRTHTTGVTTAAGLWATGSMGLVVGCGYVECALLMCLIIFIVQVPMYRLDSSYVKLTTTVFAYVEMSPDFRLSEMIIALKENHLHLNAIDRFGTSGDDYCGYMLEIGLDERSLTGERVIEILRGIDKVQFAQRMEEARS